MSLLIENANKKQQNLQECFVCSERTRKVCQSCKKIAYCSLQCQSKDWETQHSAQCKLLKVDNDKKMEIQNLKRNQSIGLLLNYEKNAFDEVKEHIILVINRRLNELETGKPQRVIKQREVEEEYKLKLALVFIDDLLSQINSLPQDKTSTSSSSSSTASSSSTTDSKPQQENENKMRENNDDDDNDNNENIDYESLDLSNIKTLEDVSKFWKTIVAISQKNVIKDTINNWEKQRVKEEEEIQRIYLFPRFFIDTKGFQILIDEDLPFLAIFMGKFLLLYLKSLEDVYDEFFTIEKYKNILPDLTLKYDSLDFYECYFIIFGEYFDRQTYGKDHEIFSIPRILKKMIDLKEYIDPKMWYNVENARVLWRKGVELSKNIDIILISPQISFDASKMKFELVLSDPVLLEDILQNANSRPVDLSTHNSDAKNSFYNMFLAILNKNYVESIQVIVKYGFDFKKLGFDPLFQILNRNEDFPKTDRQKIILIENLLLYNVIDFFAVDTEGENVLHHCNTKKMAAFIIDKILDLYQNKKFPEIKDRKILNDPVLLEKVRKNLLKNPNSFYNSILSEEENLKKGKERVISLLKQRSSQRLKPEETAELKRTFLLEDPDTSYSYYPILVDKKYKKIDEDLKELGEYYHSTLEIFERSLKKKTKRIRNDDNDTDVNDNNKDDDDDNEDDNGGDKSKKKMKKIEVPFNVLAEKVKDFDRNEEMIKDEIDRLLQFSIDVENMDRINSDLIWLETFYQKEYIPSYDGIYRDYKPYGLDFGKSLKKQLEYIKYRHILENQRNFNEEEIALKLLEKDFPREFALQLLEYLPGGKYHASVLNENVPTFDDDSFTLPQEGVLTPLEAFNLIKILDFKIHVGSNRIEKLFSDFNLDTYRGLKQHIETNGIVFSSFILNQIFSTNKAFVKMFMQQFNIHIKNTREMKTKFVEFEIWEYVLKYRVELLQTFKQSDNVYPEFGINGQERYVNILLTYTRLFMRITLYDTESFYNTSIKHTSGIKGLSVWEFINFDNLITIKMIKFINKFIDINWMNLISILSDTVNRFGYKGNKFVIRPLINYILKHTLLSSSRKNFSEEIAAILKFYTSYANIYSYDRISIIYHTRLLKILGVIFSYVTSEDEIRYLFSQSINGNGGIIMLYALRSFSETSPTNYQMVKYASNQSEHGTRPIFLAIKTDNIEVLTLLLQCGAYVNVFLDYSDNAYVTKVMTPLHVAAMRGNVEMISLLRFFGADETERDTDGKLAIDYAKTVLAKKAFEGPPFETYEKFKIPKFEKEEEEKENNDVNDDNDDDDDDDDDDDKEENDTKLDNKKRKKSNTEDDDNDDDNDDDDDDKVIVIQKDKKKRIECEVCAVELPERKNSAHPPQPPQQYRFCSLECKMMALKLHNT